MRYACRRRWWACPCALSSDADRTSRPDPPCTSVADAAREGHLVVHGPLLALGRKLAEGFIPHWAAKPSYEPAAAVDKMNDTHKVVFSRTLTTSAWPNTTVAGGPLGDEVHKLKAGPGGDLIAYGGGTFVASLLAEGLVDDIHLMVNPVALGSGMKVFPSRLGYELVKATPFACGIVALNYRPGR